MDRIYPFSVIDSVDEAGDGTYKFDRSNGTGEDTIHFEIKNYIIDSIDMYSYSD